MNTVGLGRGHRGDLRDWVGVSGLVLYLQVWLRHDAALAQQGHSREAVGTAVEQELPLRGAVAAATSWLPLIWSSFSLGGHPRNPRSHFGVQSSSRHAAPSCRASRAGSLPFILF